MDYIIENSANEFKSYRNFAFISYSSKDVKWAEWIQKKLETYRLPSKIRKEHSALPKRIFPVFRDATDLSGVVLEESLHKELDESKFLIVICTPNSAASKWVGKEIEYFRSIGGEKRIIPLIVDTEADGIEACVHDEIKNIKPELLGVDVTKLGKNEAFLRVVADMLDLRYDELLMRERKRKKQQGIMAGTVSFIFLSLLFGLCYYNMEHSTYYSGYILENEIPKGTEVLSGSEISKRVSSYRIVKRYGKVRRLEAVNNKKELLQRIVLNDQVDYPLQEFTYNDEGELVEITTKDEKRNVKQIKKLNYENNEISMDFHTYEDEITADTMKSAVNELDEANNVTRQINTYNDKGQKIKERYYKDNVGGITVNAIGIYGRNFTYNSYGLLESEVFVDQDGNICNCIYGYAMIKYGYDDKLLVTEEYLDKDGNASKDKNGVYMYRTEYDENENVVRIKNYAEDGSVNNSKEKFASLELVVENGEYVALKYYGKEDEPVLNSIGIHERRWEHDGKGRVIKESYYDTEGNLVTVKDNNYAIVTFGYYDGGKVYEEKFYDTNGNPCYSRECGTHGIKCEYTESGKIKELIYLDKDDSLMKSVYGMARSVSEEYENGDFIKEFNYDENGNLCSDYMGVAVRELEYGPYGSIHKIKFYNEKEEPCYSINGVSQVERQYEQSKIVSEKYFGINGEAVLVDDLYHEVRYSYDDFGNIRYGSYHDTEGKLALGKEGFAVMTCARDKFGRVILCSYLDEEMKPSEKYYCGSQEMLYDERNNVKYAEYEVFENGVWKSYNIISVYDDRDNIVNVFYMDEAGKNVEGRWGIKYEYDERDRLIKRTNFYTGDSGVIEEFSYDSMDNVIGEHKTILTPDGGNTTYASLKYNDFGNNTEYIYTDKDGNIVNGIEGWALRLRKYSPTGEVISEEFFDASGNPVMPEANGIA